MNRLLLTFCGLFLIQFSLHAAVVAYLNDRGGLVGVQRSEAVDAASAVAALGTPPSAAEAGQQLLSAVPAGTRVVAFQVTEGSTVIEFSPEIIGAGLDDARLETVFRQVRATLEPFELPGSIRMQCQGQLLSSYLAPRIPLPVKTQPKPAAASAAKAVGLSGKKISLSPGHGLFWNGSAWATARPVYCAPLLQEDYHNLQVASFLSTYLAQDGATVKNYRCVDQNYGTYTPASHPYWHMAACYWTKQLGYPCSVYASYTGDCNLASGGTETNDGIRAGPVAADYDNTDAHVAIHSNGSSGYCVGTGCPTGTETFYDSDPEHAAYTAVSKSLATYVQNSVISAIQSKYPDAAWKSRGVKDAAGAYAETRIPQRPAILIELAFHDTCDHDALYLQDNFFRSTTMWAIYKGICDYFGTTPTWDYYSCEAVTNTLPAIMAVGATTNVQITLRNRGVLWNDTKLFRLGAVNDSDPFTATTRYNVDGEISPGQTKTFTFTLTAPTTPGTYTSDWRMVREGYTWFGPTVSQSITVVDTTPPSTPTNVVAAPASPTTIELSWSPASDNVGVSSYRVYRGASLLGSITGTNYTDATCAAATPYNYQVSALDAATNESPKSSIATATTPALEPPTLSFGAESNLLHLSWSSGVLQQADALTGSTNDWSDVPGANSPYQPPMGADMKYYRLRY